MNMSFPVTSNHHNLSNVVKIDQSRIVRSIVDKCDLIDNLSCGIEYWVADKERNRFNRITIDELVSSSLKMLGLIIDESLYMEAAYELEKTLLKLNRTKDAAKIYSRLKAN
jgi:UDP-N-acetyl-D-mannosaminuronic acid transferase (WecB/TagA/CpsF family)